MHIRNANIKVEYSPANNQILILSRACSRTLPLFSSGLPDCCISSVSLPVMISQNFKSSLNFEWGKSFNRVAVIQKGLVNLDIGRRLLAQNCGAEAVKTWFSGCN